MEIWLWALIGIMAMIIIALFVKIRILQKSAKEIETAFADRLIIDTNTLIDISTSDKYMRSLANVINIQLRKLRAERHRFRHGDTELKNAVTNISHDLRTPLTAICGYLDLLEAEDIPERANSYVMAIQNRAEALKQLTEELFRYSIIMSANEPMQLEPICVNNVLEESLVSFYAALTKCGITPQIDIAEKKIIRTLNRTALLRVFSNILNNAIKYSDSDLKATLLETGEIIFSNTAQNLNDVQVGKLFDRFFSVETARNGAGLGLSISKTLVEQMHGTITAQYCDGVFSICLNFPEYDTDAPGGYIPDVRMICI